MTVEDRPGIGPKEFIINTERGGEALIAFGGAWRNIVKYAVKDTAGIPIGWLEVIYHLGGTCALRIVVIDEDKRGIGYGKAIYEQIPNLPSPDGKKYTFTSSTDLSESARRVWESLVKAGKAVLKEDGSYAMLYKVK